METFNFTDHDSGDDCCVIVRTASGPIVGLAVSLRRNGDIETFMPPGVGSFDCPGDGRSG